MVVAVSSVSAELPAERVVLHMRERGRGATGPAARLELMADNIPVLVSALTRALHFARVCGVVAPAPAGQHRQVSRKRRIRRPS